MLEDGLEDRGKEQQESQVLVRRLAGLEQVDAIELVVGGDGHRPVAVLAGAVDAGERLLVQQRHEPVPHGHLAEDRHDELVVVGGDVRLFEDGGHLELAGRDFVVARDDGHAQAIELVLHLGDAGLHALGDAAEVVVFELLAARRRRADDGAAAHHEIGAQGEVPAVDQEVFLLGAHGRVDAHGALVAEELEHFHGLVREHVGRAEERGDFVERLAVVADEDRGNAQRLGARRFHDEDG